MTLQEAISLLSAYHADSPRYGEGQAEVEARYNAQEINTATRLISDYAMKGGDVSGLPPALQQYATPDYANFVASRGSGTLRTALPALAVAGGGLAGVLAGGATAAGAGAGTEAAGTYGAAGEFAGGAYGASGAAPTLAEQAASIGGGSAAGTAAGTGVGTGTDCGI